MNRLNVNRLLIVTLAFALIFIVMSSFSYAQGRPENIRTAEYTQLQKNLCRGWNTWNTNSVLSHVHLPEAFAVNLCIKNSGTGEPYMNTFYKANETLGRPEKIKLGSRSDDGSYTELEMRISNRSRIKVQSASEGDELFLLVTVLERDKFRPPYLTVEAGTLWNRNGQITKNGNTINAKYDGRSFTLKTTSKTVEDPFTTSNSPYLSIPLDGEIGIYTGKVKTLEEIKSLITSRQKEYVSKPLKYGELSETFRAMQTVLAWNVIYDPENNRVISPVSRLWNTNWGGYVLFDWDTYFASMMYSMYNKELSYANAVEVTKGITKNGFIPNCQSAYNIKSDDRSQPPVGSLAVLYIYNKYHEKWFLEEVYDELITWNRWWPAHRDSDGYLCWGSDLVTGQLVDGTVNTWQGAAYESGLDNSPMYDNVPFNTKTHLMELADVGLMSFYISDCKALADISQILGKNKEAAELNERAAKYSEKLDTLWDEKTGIYLNKRIDNGQFSYRLSTTNFYPLLAKVPSQDKANRMIKEHFFNENEFMGEWIMPSIAKNDPAFKDQAYWRGRIWGADEFSCISRYEKLRFTGSEKSSCRKVP